MGIDETGGNQRAAVIVPRRLRMGGLQRSRFAHGDDPAVFDQNRPIGDMTRGLRPFGKGICGEGQHLPQK